MSRRAPVLAAAAGLCAALAGGCATVRPPADGGAVARDASIEAFGAAALAAGAAVSGDPRGPRLLVVAGAHGDEPSGVVAAERLAAAPTAPARGAIAAIPRASPSAVAAGTRSAPGEGDFNRSYGSSAPRPAAILALASLCDLVLDLHEEGGAWPEADLPTLVISPAAASLALDLVEALRDRGLPFAVAGGAPAGSLVGELGARGRAAMVVEAPARLALEERAALHEAVAEESLRLLGAAR